MIAQRKRMGCKLVPVSAARIAFRIALEGARASAEAKGCREADPAIAEGVGLLFRLFLPGIPDECRFPVPWRGSLY